MDDPLAPPSIWELAHPDGSSIFVQHATKGGDGENDAKFTFGPFFFLSFDDLQRHQGTDGPHHLMRVLSTTEMIAQQVSLDWVIEHASNAFEPLGTDCIVVGEMLVPFSEAGAILADTSINNTRGADTDDEGYDWITPWTDMCEEWGVRAMRLMNADIIAKLASPTIPN